MARVAWNPQNPQDATFYAFTTTTVHNRSRASDVWMLESEIYDDFLDPDACFLLLVFFTLGVPLYSILFFAYVHETLADTS